MDFGFVSSWVEQGSLERERFLGEGTPPTGRRTLWHLVLRSGARTWLVAGKVFDVVRFDGVSSTANSGLVDNIVKHHII